MTAILPETFTLTLILIQLRQSWQMRDINGMCADINVQHVHHVKR